MIDIYHNIEKLGTEKKIIECLGHYRNNNFKTWQDIYKEYDDIKKIKISSLSPDYNDKNEFFIGKKNSRKLRKIRTNFMKECLLESLKRLIDERVMQESNDLDSELNHNIDSYRLAEGGKDTKDHFVYYPDIYENDISDKLCAKEELRRHAIPNEMGSIKDKCDSDFFELAPHQLFLKNLISPNTHYYGLLIFHGVGVGKSCSGISIAENFRDIYGQEENKIIILASQNIRIGWKKTIFDPSKGGNQCTGSDYYYDDDDPKIDDKYAKKKIKKYYELHGYAAFANSVRKMLKEGCRHISDEKQKLIHQEKLIRDTYSNRVLIIDEVHNIRSGESQKQGRDTILYIEMVIKYSDKLRLILLTANPMYNLSTEIIWILNMLLLNDNKPIIKEKDIFDKEGNLISDGKGEALLKYKSKGYISYLRGENPISFPVRLYPSNYCKNPELNPVCNEVLSRIIKKPEEGETDMRPKLDLFSNEMKEDSNLSFLELYSSKLIDQQLKIYTNECNFEPEQISLQIDTENILLQLSNIVYPGQSESFTDLYGETGLMNTMNLVKNEYSYQSETLENYGEYFHRDEIGKYSAKIKSILEIIASSEGIVFIYSNWINSGVVPLVLALEQNGYTRSGGKEVLKNSKKVDKISISGEYYSDSGTDKTKFIKANYMVIAGSGVGTNNLEEELKMVTSIDNKNGKAIKIIIGSSVAAEGFDFKNIRSIHILEPWHNINKVEQVIGRGIRNCSHGVLEDNERNVTIYLHSSSVPDKESIDSYLYRYSEKKALQIGQIENILKSNALDKYLFQNGNHFGKNDIDMIKVKPAYRGIETFSYDISDKKYSRVCSFSPNCNYMAKDKKTIYHINKGNELDTFQMKYSSSVIEIYKKRIHNLYRKAISYTFNELMTTMKDNNEIYDDYLYHSLKEMISEKYTLHNFNGDKGYLTRSDKYYLFQPYYNNDKLLPTYYRLNRGHVNHVEYEIKMKDKKINTFLYEKHKFTNDRMNKSYNNLIKFDYKYKVTEKNSEQDVKVSVEPTVFGILGFMKGDTTINNPITISYRFDRLLIDDKLVIGYSVLLHLKEELSESEIIFDKEMLNIMVSCLQRLFIYYDGTKYYYQDIWNGKSDELVGFFLYHNNDRKPLYYHYFNREIEIFNKVDEIDVVRMIKANRNSKSLSLSGSWGFLTYSERIMYNDEAFNYNGIVLKVIKSSDKVKKNYVYPTGPGIIIQDQATGAWIGKSTYKFILDEFKDIFDSLKERDKQFLQKYGGELKGELKGEKKGKRFLVCFIECCLRMKNLCIQNDLIFMKYY